MAIAELKGKEVPIKLWTKLDAVESEALTQLKNIASLPWAFHHVAVMPDVHFGIGATVGSVIAMKDAISPAAVGVDIGCGMGAIRTNLKADQLPDNLTKIRSRIEERIPVGHHEHKNPKIQSRTNALFAEFRSLHPKVMDLESKAVRQCGTLGGGNHFIELCLDTENTVWMMLHSGSRNIGKTLAEIHIKTAKKLSHNMYLPDRDLAVFLANTPEMEAYRRDLFWAQRYALLNRQTMFVLYKKVLQEFFPNIEFEEPILCHHNYVSEETHFGEKVVVTRKGAISAREGEWGIIPGSMGTKSFIVKGLGNPESFHSASHGAGRRVSRTQAKKEFSLEDLAKQTSGVECRKDAGVLDEIPGAYKNIDEVIENQKDLVKVEYILKQILCVKG
ncbi:MAG TPA: RtcB family protein [Leptospiraceae bacterium]|nr:RtcB family protein [Leptospiraceae bacterium]HMW07139.1 RtcB family protein [Leptospiraceae bacterium]HMX31813.1 RtcB family protein [Leptospiraceae bacterium]HMY32544.1 RtcB family protein [Leptospiraceae bacterium]HMZ67019.1 RtcB family protein [Leptospiraceae bacterium]